ncbi:unnamed protein product [Allacma fusca]|uniref:Uncharacterized protein n=1 Tax=Allacma fusca TaxID=39272 RepID=A0A8J2NV75_9HEXA|nr:unnamed protein product [Allacma fusca]
MDPYKQVFSKQPACGSGGGDDGGPDGNPPSGGKERFYLPKVLQNRDRYCSVCGQTVKENWKFCRNSAKLQQFPSSHRDENREALNEQQRSYRDENREALNEQQRSYRDENSEAVNEQQRSYRY